MGVLVWQLQPQNSPPATPVKTFLVRLSGRPMKKKCPVTLSALFEGLWWWLTMMATLEHYSTTQFTLLKQVISSWGLNTTSCVDTLALKKGGNLKLMAVPLVLVKTSCLA